MHHSATLQKKNVVKSATLLRWRQVGGALGVVILPLARGLLIASAEPQGHQKFSEGRPSAQGWFFKVVEVIEEEVS
jgi:hypothetical protein